MNAIGVLEARILELRREEVELRAASEILSLTGLRVEMGTEGHLEIKVDKVLVDPPPVPDPDDQAAIDRRLRTYGAP